jgi:quercetin dioxygenase-like cupin family protein
MKATAFSWPDVAEDNPIQLLHRRKILGEKMLVARVSLKKGCLVTTHHHDSEQIAMVQSGHVRWNIGADDAPERYELEMRGGEVLVLPSNVPHGIMALEDTEIIDVLSPAGAMGIDSQKD